MTYFLRFTDETAFNTACNDAGLWIDDNNPRPALISHTHTIDVLGPLVQVSFTGNSINWSDEDEGIIFNVALNDDKTGWVIKQLLLNIQSFCLQVTTLISQIN
jgi:hypothetical protein